VSSVLAGRRIVITRAAEQADELAALLQQVGAVPIVIPLIEIVPDVAEVTRLADLAAADVAGFDWLIVTSPNGAACVVNAFAQRPGLSRCRFAAVGSTTAEVLRAAGIEVAFVPGVQSAAGMLAEITEVRNVDAVLLVQAANANRALEDGLRGLVAAVTVVAPYRTVTARISTGQQLAALAADAVLFASGSAAQAWVDVFGDSTPPIVVAIGPQTAVAVTDAGLKVSVVAADHSLSGMIAALEQHLSGQR